MNRTEAVRRIFSSFLDNGINSESDYESIRKIRLLNISSFFCAVFLIPLSVKSFLLGNYFQVVADYLVLSLFLVSFFYIKITTRYGLAAHIVIHTLCFFLIYLIYLGGIGNTGPVWIFIFPMAAFFLHGLRKGLGYTVFFTVCLAVLLLSNISIPGSAEYNPVFRKMIFFSYLASALFAALYEIVREDNFQKLKRAGEKLDDMAKHDPLTGLMNRRGIQECLEYEKGRSMRNSTPFSVLMGDIDIFKRVNDKYGHDAGDYVLTQLSSIFKSRKRSQDLIGRWGGEEFLFLLPDTDLRGAMAHADEIRKTVETSRFSFLGTDLKICMSFGAAEIGFNTTPNDGISEADKYLLLAKARGRNMVLSELDMEPELS